MWKNIFCFHSADCPKTALAEKDNRKDSFPLRANSLVYGKEKGLKSNRGNRPRLSTISLSRAQGCGRGRRRGTGGAKTTLALGKVGLGRKGIPQAAHPSLSHRLPSTHPPLCTLRIRLHTPPASSTSSHVTSQSHITPGMSRSLQGRRRLVEFACSLRTRGRGGVEPTSQQRALESLVSRPRPRPQPSCARARWGRLRAGVARWS